MLPRRVTYELQLDPREHLPSITPRHNAAPDNVYIFGKEVRSSRLLAAAFAGGCGTVIATGTAQPTGLDKRVRRPTRRSWCFPGHQSAAACGKDAAGAEPGRPAGDLIVGAVPPPRPQASQLRCSPHSRGRPRLKTAGRCLGRLIGTCCADLAAGAAQRLGAGILPEGCRRRRRRRWPPAARAERAGQPAGRVRPARTRRAPPPAAAPHRPPPPPPLRSAPASAHTSPLRGSRLTSGAPGAGAIEALQETRAVRMLAEVRMACNRMQLVRWHAVACGFGACVVSGSGGPMLAAVAAVPHATRAGHARRARGRSQCPRAPPSRPGRIPGRQRRRARAQQSPAVGTAAAGALPESGPA